MSKFLRRVKSTKGINGVIVALLLIMVGVGAVAGIKTFMDDSKNSIQSDINTSLTNMGTNNNVAVE